MNSATVALWGNSLAVRIPRGLAEKSQIKEGDVVQIEENDGVISLTKIRKVKQYDLKNILGCFRPAGETSELGWGIPQGREIF